MFAAKKINDVKVEPIPQKGGAKKIPRGAELFPTPYANIFPLAKKNTGKTTTLFEILKRRVMAKTHVLVFCSTIHKDKSWKAIKKWCQERSIAFTGHTDLYNDKKQNRLEELLKDLEEESDSDEEDEKTQHVSVDEHGVETPVKVTKRKKPTYAPLDYFIVFDDMGKSLRDPAIGTLLKKNRHLHSEVIISSQYVTDLQPESRKQIEYWLLFPNLSDENLKMVHDSSGISLDLDAFRALYRAQTTGPHDFLYLEVSSGLFRKNFNTALVPPAAAPVEKSPK